MAGESRRTSDEVGGRRGAGGRAALASVGLFLLLALFGARWHWVEEAGSAERDAYVAQAEAILAGELPRDPFRPALYPLAIAGLGALGAEPFTAARLLSNAAAAALALLAFAFARRLAAPEDGGGRGGGERAATAGDAALGDAAVGDAAVRGGTGAGGAEAAGWWAFALVAVNPNLWILGQHASTDAAFAALAAAALLAGLAYLRSPSWRPALAAGAALGLAAFTRGNALFLAPGLALAWLLAPRRERRLGHLAGLAAVALLLLAPHFALRAAAFGDPLHDENWKNVAWKLHGHPDWSYLERVPYSGPGELLREEGGAIVAAAAAELGRFARSGLAQLLGTPLHALAFVAGAVAALAWRRRTAGWLLAAAGAFLAGVALVFFAWGRLVLVLLPIGAALTVAPWVAGWRRGAFDRWLARLPGLPATAGSPAGAASRRRLLRRGGTVAALGLLALLTAKTFLFRLPAFVERHPVREVAAVRQLAAATPPGTVLAGTSPFLGRYVDRRYVDLPDAFGPEIAAPELYYRRLRRLVAAEGIDYLVVGRLDLRDRPTSLLAEAPPVPWLAPAGGYEEVRIWRVTGAGPRAPLAALRAALGNRLWRSADIGYAPTPIGLSGENEKTGPRQGA